MKTFTQSEMLAWWKRRLGLAASPGLSGYSDRTQLDTYLLDDIESWYEKLLLTAPPELLPRENVASEARCAYLSDNCAEIVFPDRARRLLRVKMHEWRQPIDRFVAPDSPKARMQQLQYARGNMAEPVAVLMPDRVLVHGLDSDYRVNPAMEMEGFGGAQPQLELLEMVARPADGSYRLHRSLLRLNRD